MFAGPLFLWHLGRISGEKGIIIIPLVILQNVIGMVSFGLLRSYYRKINSTTEA
jgi:hypothetical protein